LELDLLDPNHHGRKTLYGLGGCGKSALALEFAYRALARDANHLVCWVPALSQESFELAYRNIGRYLHIPGISNDNADVIGLVKEKLSSESSGNWLMIVDNVDDLSIMFGTSNDDPASIQLNNSIPYSNQGTVLFTTRSKDIAEELTSESVIELDELSKADARQLLARRVTKRSLLNEEIAVDELLETLTYLPLAIVQAAAFMNNNHITVSEYRSLFQHPGSEAELFSKQFEDPNRYPDMDNTIATTWHISFNQLRKQKPLAAKYISFMACLDRFNIPQSLLPPGGTPIQQTVAIGTLLGYAFITERQRTDQDPGGDRVFDMHRLVHTASIGWLEEHNERATWMATAVARLEELIPTDGDHEKREFWTTYLPHAVFISGLDDVGQATKGSLLDRVARCQADLGRYSAATETYRQALSIRSECLGPEHPASLTTMDGLALVHNSLGKHKEAVDLDRRTLARREKVLGRNHETTLTTMNNLAVGLRKQGMYAEAEILCNQALERQKKQFGLQHPGTLLSMSNLAELLAIRGSYKEAEATYTKIWYQQDRLYGEKHPNTLLTLYSLTKITERTMDDADGWSEKEFRKVLQLQEEVVGPDHPHSLSTSQSLACLRARLGQFQEAEAMLRRILALREEIFGLNHIETVTTVYKLAHTVKDQRRWGEAAELLDRACTGFYTCFGKDDPMYKQCTMEMIKVRERDYSENGPPSTDEPHVVPPMEDWKVPTINMDGHPNGNREPWDPHLPPAIEFTTDSKSSLTRSSMVTTGRKSNLARSLVAKMGINKLLR
jgi:tetratricopeptide (TPR) repeat protein